MASEGELKRHKVSYKPDEVRKSASKIFSPFRIIGNVTNEIPFAVGTLGSTYYIVTCVGKSFQIYDANNLHLLFVAEKETEFKITCLATHFHHVFAGFGSKVGIYKRGKLVYLLELPNQNVEVNNICIFGDYLCVSANDNCVYVFRKSTGNIPTEFYTQLTIAKLEGYDIVSLLHMPTYLNKLVVVTKSNVLLFNIRTGKLLFTSNEFAAQITTSEVSPILDILALGTLNGDVMMYNIRKGKVIRTIKTLLKISSLSFRTDGCSHLSVASLNGDLFFYDLDRKTRIHILKNIHNETYGGISKATFLGGQPIIVTSGGDNRLKEYVFDPSLSQNDSESVIQPPRFLRSRGGHSQSPTSIMFADSQSHFLLSASRDRSLWGFSLRKDAQSQEFSQRLHKRSDNNRIGGNTLKEKFPEIINMTIENARQGEWENILTAHKDEKLARTWNSRTKRVGRWTFSTDDDGFVKSTAISQCGNFGMIGSSNGSISVYNLQSGLKRKLYKFHKKAVTGIAIDGMNKKMVSCGLDGIIGFYDFNKSTLLGKIQLDAPITSMIYHKSSDLLALALDDFSIIVVDAITQRVVRQLWGHKNRISSFDFSPDGRWIVSASLDSTLRTWDLPTAGCIDGVKLESVATNVRFSPNGDLLATTHVIGNGICLWTNKGQFVPVSNRQIEENEFGILFLPNESGNNGSSILDGALDDQNLHVTDDNNFAVYQSVGQIHRELITLSLEPKNKMNTLLNLDTIRKRSKPKAAPKKSEKSPFFLQLTGEKVGDDASGREGVLHDNSLAIRSQQNTEDKDIDAQIQLNKFRPSGRIGFESQFTKLLREAGMTNEFSIFLDTLIGLSPSAADLEIRSLNSFEPFDEICWFIKALTAGLKTNENFELYEAFMSMLFKVHGDVIQSHNKNELMSVALNNWNEEHKNHERLDELVKFCSGVINFVMAS